MKLDETMKQSDLVDDFFINSLPDWVTVYSYKTSTNNISETSICKYSCLCPIDHIEKTLKNHSWDLCIGSGLPGLITYGFGKESKTEYSRYGNDDDIEPLVITQSFHGVIEDPAPRISEEFILFLNLFQKDNTLYAITDDGESEEAVRYREKEILIRKKYLMRFIAAKQVALLLFIDSTYSIVTDEKYTNFDEKVSEDLYTYARYSSSYPISPYNATSILMGKRIIIPPKREEYYKESFERPNEKYEEFIYKEDANGEPLEFSCEPDHLANNFGANKDNPHFLTPIFFKKMVLKKYYEDPEKYNVTDGYLSCGGLWGLRMDNDLISTVMVFLGDLGQTLSAKEQKHWKTFNIPPSDNFFSPTSYQRSFLGEFCDPGCPEFEFKQLYRDFNDNWKNTYGWDLFHKPTNDIENNLKKFRIPLEDTDNEFEEAILLLSKIINDRLDKHQIKRQIDRELTTEEEGFGSIKLLGLWLKENNISTDFADVLQQIQLLRSKKSAHTEQSGYQKILREILGKKTKAQLIVNVIFRINDFFRRYKPID